MYWSPVHVYVGGFEHVVLHLLYSRFWHQVLYDIGVVSTKELFKCVINQGIILGEVQYMASKDQDGNFVSVKFLHWESIHTKGYQGKRFKTISILFDYVRE